MARRNTAEKQRKAKEAKQKKLLFVLIPLFLGLVVWQGPKMYKAFFSSPEAAPAPAVTTTPTDPAATPPPTTTQGGVEAPLAPSAGLVDTDVPPASAKDRLFSFSRFESRDPFGRPGGTAATDSGTPDPDVDLQALVARLEVNGSSEDVSIGDDFPAADPTFRLVSISESTAVLGLVSGAFEDGETTVTLAVGESLELVADPDGTRYTVTLVSVG